MVFPRGPPSNIWGETREHGSSHGPLTRISSLFTQTQTVLQPRLQLTVISSLPHLLRMRIKCGAWPPYARISTVLMDEATRKAEFGHLQGIHLGKKSLVSFTLRFQIMLISLQTTFSLPLSLCCLYRVFRHHLLGPCRSYTLQQESAGNSRD